MKKLLKCTKRTSCILALLSSFWIVSTAVSANPHVPNNGDETILIDYKPSTKIPYSKLVRAVTKHFFSFDSESLVTFGQGDRTRVARNFSDYMDRTKTRVNLGEDSIEVKMKMYF